jgi:hypothetical protein
MDHGAMTYEIAGVSIPFLATALDGGEWSTARRCPVIAGGRAAGSHSDYVNEGFNTYY